MCSSFYICSCIVSVCSHSNKRAPLYDDSLSVLLGVVKFTDVVGARNVASVINGITIRGRKLQAIFLETHSMEATTAAAVVFAAEYFTVFISNLAWTTSEDDIFALACSYGEIESIEIKRHADTHKPKGWGLVVFRKRESAELAIQALNGCEVNGRKLTLRIDRAQIPDIGSICNVYVGNLNFTMDDSTLHQMFSAFHPLSSDIARTSFGNSRGFGIVKLSNPEDATAAIAATNKMEMCGRIVEVRHRR